MSVRHATADAVPDIARVHTASWEGVYRGLMPDTIFDRMTIERRVEGLSRYMATRPSRTALLVSETGDEIVGLAGSARAATKIFDMRALASCSPYTSIRNIGTVVMAGT